MIRCIVIAGPTSSGKSEAAVEVAKKINGEIISADSRQVYKDMDLGTGKVGGSWKSLDGQDVFLYQEIPHYLIDFQDPREEYNASHFKKDCQEKIIQIHQKGKVPIICGGTGFWISSAVYGISLPKVKPDPELRATLEKLSNEELMEELKSLDQKRAEKVDPGNRHRIIRSIEIAKKLGGVPPKKTAFYKKNSLPTRKIESLETSFEQYAVFPGMEKLEEKIKKRLDGRFKSGMIEEVKSLKEKYGLDFKDIQAFGLAYYWIPLYLQAEVSEKELLERVYLAERRYAKRQLTWLKKEKEWKWVEGKKKAQNIISP